MALQHKNCIIRRFTLNWLYVPFFILTITSLSCSLGGRVQPGTATEAALSPTTPTPLPESLPPALLESNPPAGAELSLNSQIELTFNQSMNKASVEAAVNTGGVAGRFEWKKDAVMTFIPDASLMPDSDFKLQISVTAQSSRGMPLNKPIELQYKTPGLLKLSQFLPEDGQGEVNPNSALIAAFNQPVVPLGADPGSLPAAFVLEPSAPGRSEWINTSTYIFYPEPGLSGGQTYTASLNPDLKSTAGTALEKTTTWTFSTASPLVTGFEVQDSLGVNLDTSIKVHFNQSMDPSSSDGGFTLSSPGGRPVDGVTTWDESFTTLVFTPTNLLERATTYEINLSPEVKSASGSPLAEPYQASWVTVGAFFLVSSNPGSGQTKEDQGAIFLNFSSPLPEKGFESYFRFEPAVENLNIFPYQDESSLMIYGDFKPSSNYILHIDPELKDRWGDAISTQVSVPFRTAPLRPRLDFANINSVLYLTPQDTGIGVQLTNLTNLPMSLDSASASDLIALTSQNGYELRQNFVSADHQTWRESFSIPSDVTTPVQLPLNRDGSGLEPGIYILGVDLESQLGYPTSYVMVVSNVHLTYKISPLDVLVWAVDIRTSQPIANAPLTVYNENGDVVASGLTNDEGIFTSTLTKNLSLYEASTVVMGQPGEELFSAAVSGWSQGIDPYNFSIQSDYSGPGPLVYLYTDRPIYRPGQTVSFRAILRQQSNGRYSLAEEVSTLPVKIYDGQGAELASFEMPLSAFGSAHGEYKLISDAKPGYYRIESDQQSIIFQVAEYRKPEINLQIAFDREQVLAGDPLQANINARYFFDAPAGNIELTWTLYESSDSLFLPGFQTGPQNDYWLYGISRQPFYPELGIPIAQGNARTAPDGTYTLQVENPVDSENFGKNTRRYSLEVTVKDESGLPVSARGSVRIHPSEFYIGIQPDLWVSKAGQESGFDIIVVDWQQNPAGSRKLSAFFNKVTYIRQEQPAGQAYSFATWKPEYTQVASADFATGPDGKARLAFTAPDPGTYLLEVRSEGALTQVLLWSGGAGQAIWPNLPNQRLQLTPDRDSYTPGDTALIFVPNPFPDSTDALLTIERGVVMRHEIRNLAPGGTSISVPLTSQDSPNVYVSITLLGKNEKDKFDFRQGYAELKVAPIEQTLTVNLTSQPEKTGPGSEVTFALKVTDSNGQPVQGEFSLAVTDLAALSLADPNSKDILPAFYGIQPLGVHTNLSLAAYGNRTLAFDGGIGGGGGGDVSPNVVRDNFPDTAYWDAVILTDDNGDAQVSLRLPDSLTTWQVDVRGITPDTRVGQATGEIVTSKDVLIRPVVPRFLVSGDHVELAAVVQNNTQVDLPAQVSLQAEGFVLDEGSDNQVKVVLPAGARVKVTWWGTAQDALEADLVFNVQAGEYQDTARPTLGSLPVIRYTTRQAFATSGFLEGAVQQLELVSLPPSALVSDLPGEAGKLDIELAPSLTAALLTSLDVLEYYPYDSTEQTLAKFLPNLFLHQALISFNIQVPEIQARLERTLQPGIQTLIARQNADGGWGWWSGNESDPYITSYVLFGLTQAQQAGANISPNNLQQAIDYLNATQVPLEQITEPYLLDRLAFQLFSLAEAGSPDGTRAQALYPQRDMLSPWGKALLALALETSSPGSSESADLLAVLQAEAQRSATGAFWSDPNPGWKNLNNTVSTTAMVVYALSLREPASTVLPDAIRFIMASRGAQGTWSSTFETTWCLLAVSTYTQGTGELSGDFSFRATLNNIPLVSGQAEADTRLTPVQTSISVTQLYPTDPNALRIERSEGGGRLYYTAFLDVAFPADQVQAYNGGFVVDRSYIDPAHCSKESCPAVTSGGAGQQVEVRLVLVVPQDVYHVLLEDFIPAGSEILDRSLKTTQLGDPAWVESEPKPLYNPVDPYTEGWGWWLFNPPTIFDDHIAWSASYLPAGTYELAYTLTLLQPGEYRLLPARATQLYFPDVQGNSTGAVFNIEP